MQFLYADGADAHFMDSASFEQIAVPERRARARCCAGRSRAARWTCCSSTTQPSDIQLPSAVDLEVTETEPGLRGDTASGGGTKPATLETGAAVQVPLFVNVGERVRVDTRTGEYVSRA